MNGELFPNSNLDLKAIYGLEIPISWETARVWMHALGFHYKAHSKNVYVDGHNRPDVLKWKEGYLFRQFEWADDSKSIPGYTKRANLVRVNKGASLENGSPAKLILKTSAYIFFKKS